MEDYFLREIDRMGEMLMLIARKPGLLDGDTPDYSLTDVKEEFDKSTCPVNLDALLEHENPIRYLVESEKISDHGLEIFIDIIFHSDMEENRKAALLNDALAYLDGKGYFSFRLHSLSGGNYDLSNCKYKHFKQNGHPEGRPFCVSWLEKYPNLKSSGKSEGRNLDRLFPGLYGDSFAHYCNSLKDRHFVEESRP